MPSAAGKELAKYLEPLTHMQRLYVEARLKGLSKVAAATAAGMSQPRSNYYKFEESAAVKEALRIAREIGATEIMFTRKKAHEMLLEAHANAATATEQIFAIREMIKLHGVAAPEVKELRHQVTGKVEHEAVKRLSTEDLLRLAKLDDAQVPQVLEGEFEIVDDGRTKALATPDSDEEAAGQDRGQSQQDDPAKDR
jgi:hypothetical protein